MGHWLLAAILLAAPRVEKSVEQGDRVLRHVEEQLGKVRDYTAVIEIELNLDRLKVPPVKVTMYFKRPDKVHFDSDRFVLLPKEGMGLDFVSLRSRYRTTSASTDTIQGELFWKLTLKPIADKTGLREVFLFVNPRRWTADRLVSPLFDGRTMTAQFSYGLIDSVWLPSMLHVAFESSTSDSTADIFPEQSPLHRPQLPRSGTVIIRYSSYQLNTGLRDELFENTPSSVKP